MSVSPLAPETFPALTPVRGVTLAADHCGIRYKGRDDLMLAAFAEGTVAAGVFTQSSIAAAPVDWCKQMLSEPDAGALVINSGNANAFTGNAGMQAVKRVCEATATTLGKSPKQIHMCSTGVIGEPLPEQKIIDHLPTLHASLSETAWEACAKAIMTTDTFPKAASTKITVQGKEVVVTGIAKGSGMIAPNMATMLGFVATDAAIDKRLLQAWLSEINERTFNAITVDSDTSTNDTVLCFATGQAGNETIVDAHDPEGLKLKQALEKVLLDLALQIVKDGEGISKLIDVTVTGAKDDASARTIALAIGNSPLVKTAIAGEDANWGRIVMAIGKSAEPINAEKIAIRLGEILVAENGTRAVDYQEAQGAAYMKNKEIALSVDVGVGEGYFTIWTCDLTHEYIRINADYRS